MDGAVTGQVDRLLLELKLPPADAYFKLVHTLEEVRAVGGGVVDVVVSHIRSFLVSSTGGHEIRGWLRSMEHPKKTKGTHLQGALLNSWEKRWQKNEMARNKECVRGLSWIW